jgi:hypothetical protein
LVLSFNEGKACDAVIRVIEARADAQRSNVRLHDLHPESDRRIELTFELGSDLFAVEHTAIEPFADFMRMNSDSPRLFGPITRSLSPVVSPGETWELHIPLGALTDRGNKDLRRIQDALVRYVMVMAPRVPVRSYADYIGDLDPAMPPDVPFFVNLYRFDSLGLPSRFQIVHGLAGGSKEALRGERMLLACKKKFPKLAAWKNSHDARTVLILEDNDIQLTNPVVVADSFVPLAMARDDRPDETYMVMTCAEPWLVWPILVGNDTYFDLAARSDPILFEIDPTKLTPVTDR